MGREVRMVPADWQHPQAPNPYSNGEPRFIPLLPYAHGEAVRSWTEEDLPEWVEGKRLWREEGRVKTSKGVVTIAEMLSTVEPHRRVASPNYEWWAGERPEKPKAEHYMPDWPAEQRTHFMMYEDTSEGTPISPAFATPEELARWLADNEASAFAGETASYDQWLATIKRGHAVSAVLSDRGFESGVAYLASRE